MARNLYLFAVLSPSAAQQVGAESDAHTVMAHVARALEVPEPRVAFYRVILDGWDRSHERCLAQWSNRNAANLVCRQFDDGGIAWLAAEDLVEDDHFAADEIQGSEPHLYAIRAFAHAMRDWIDFIRAIKGHGILVWRCVGPSFDDAEFS